MARASNQEPKTPFARRLKSLRILAQYDTGRDFAKELAYEEARYGRWERGEVEPGIEALAKIHEVTNVPLDWLIADKKTGPFNIRVNPNFTPSPEPQRRKR